MAMTKAEKQQLLDAQNALVIRDQKIAELEKKLADKATESDRWYKSRLERDQEIDSVHSVLDCLPNAPARKMDDGYSTRPLMARLAGYFATR